MPTHVYKPTRYPPNWWDRLMVHPLDTTVAVVALMFALLLGLGACIPDFQPSASVEELSAVGGIILALAFAAAGVLVLVGLNWHGEEVSKGWALERFGWLLVAGGFIGYAISVCVYRPDSLFSWGVPLALSIGALLRFWSIVLIERTTRRTLAEVRGRMP